MTDDAHEALAEALEAEAVADRLAELAQEDRPVPQLTTEQRRALLTKIADAWRQQTGRRPIRDPDAPTHCCPNCGHRW